MVCFNQLIKCISCGGGGGGSGGKVVSTKVDLVNSASSDFNFKWLVETEAIR